MSNKLDTYPFEGILIFLLKWWPVAAGLGLIIVLAIELF